jgi:hypothetical protein
MSRNRTANVSTGTHASVIAILGTLGDIDGFGKVGRCRSRRGCLT